MSTTKPSDDLDAVRTLVEALAGFDQQEQQRIIRWAAEKLDLPQPFSEVAAPIHHVGQPTGLGLPAQNPDSPRQRQPLAQTVHSQAVDIKTFIAEKQPKNDVQLAATVAYYSQFEAPEAEKKGFITPEDLQDACRKAGRAKLKNPGQTLRNAHMLGLLDKGAESGQFCVNTVGENLVAMTLPGDGKPKPTKKRAKKGAKRSPRKKSIAKKTAQKAPSRRAVAKRAKKA